MENSQGEKRKARTGMNEMVRKMSGGNKTAGIVIAVCMVVLGILIFCAPLIMGLGIAYLVTIGFIIYGVFDIVAYVRTPADYRNGWTIANGIIFTLLGILILVEALGGMYGRINMISTFSFIIGFFALFGGITPRHTVHLRKRESREQAGSLQAVSSTSFSVF